MGRPKVSRKLSEEDELKEARRIAEDHERLRLEFYRRNGLEAPEKPRVPGSAERRRTNGYDLLPGTRRNGARQGAGRPAVHPTRIKWTCSREGCGTTFWLDPHQRVRYRKGTKRFYCSAECLRNRGHVTPQIPSNRIPVEALRHEVVAHIEGGHDTWPNVAKKIGYVRSNRTSKLGSKSQLEIALGMRPAGGKRNNGKRKTHITKDLARRICEACGIDPTTVGVDEPSS